jgi:tRNA A-37 threonylcarbamoyl transferase component Bud32
MPTDNANWVGQLLSGGRYQITAALGAGGMGLVYRARDTQLGREVVVKVPRRSMLADAGFASRFDREARSLANLPHPHIVKVLDVGTHDDMPFVVLEYLSGGSLRDRLRRDPRGEQVPRPPEELASWLEGVALALDFIHRQGFVHRDVKPDNILFDGEGHVFLSDFGIVKALTAGGEKAEQSVLTGAGLIIGTPRYLAPELILGQPYDGRADQYALAATVYETLSGRVPVDGPTSAAIVLRLKSQAIPPIHTVVSGLPASLGEALQRGLAKNPRDRYADCASFARAVVAGAAGTVAEGALGVEPVAPPAPKSKAVTTCPACRKKFTLAAAALGKRVRCPQCGEAVQTEPPPALAPTVAPRDGSGPLPETASSPRAAARPGKRGCGCFVLTALGLLGLSVAALAAGVVAFKAGGLAALLPSTTAAGGHTLPTTVPVPTSPTPTVPIRTSPLTTVPVPTHPMPTVPSRTNPTPTGPAPTDSKKAGGGGAKAGDREQVGATGVWKKTLVGAILNPTLFTIDSDGHLFHNNLRNGERKQIGDADFGNTVFLFASGGQLYAIERAGTMYRVNPDNGRWVRLEGDWKGTRAGVVHEGRLFTIENDGTLYGTELPKGEWSSIGKPRHTGTAFLFAADDSLYALDKEGSLHRVNPKDGTRQRVGQPNGWKGTVAGAVLGGGLYTVEASGALYRTNLADGTWIQVGKSEFGSTAFLFAHAEKLYAIEKDGNLYRVHVK